MTPDHILSKKAGICIAGMWFISKSTLQTAVVLAVVAVVGIICQTVLDRKRHENPNT